jgi:serine/threonine protein kinase
MPITIQCPNPACGVTATVADGASGRGVKCKRCGTPFVARPTIDASRSETRKSRPTGPAGEPFPSLPAVFGRYRVLRLLGRGGMGSVYLAEDSQLGRQVALKLPAFGPGESAQRAERFVREARSAAVLHHPNICTVFDAGQVEGRPFLTMAFIDGKPLEEVIDPSAPMPQARAAEIARKVALALAHAHAKGVVHRDLKPANVMLTADGEPVVMDFGLAKRVSDADPGEGKLTRDGAVMGTPSYMAPEQVRAEADKIGPATDVYALGVILFEMLTGQTPYTGPLGVVMGQILNAPVPPVSEFRRDVDPRLEAVCRRAMAKDPAERFPSMAALAEALDGFLKVPTSPSISVVPVVPVVPLELPPDASPFGDLGDEPAAPPARGRAAQQPQAADESPQRRRAQRYKAGQSSNRLPVLIGAAVLALLVLVAGVVLTVRTKHGDVVIELSDPNAKVEVKVDGERIEVSGLDRPLTMTAGEHGLTVSGPDFETVTRRFTVKRGERNVVDVVLKPKPAVAAKRPPVTPSPKADVPTPTTDPPTAAPAGLWGPFFNGKDLTGWVGLPEAWRVVNGAIVGKLPAGRDKATFLCTQREYRDFELKFRVWLKYGIGNSGVQVRSKLVDTTDYLVAGPQVEIDAFSSGGVYRERIGGGWMKQLPESDVRRIFKANEFNDYTIRAVGKRLTVVINGETIVDEVFPEMDDSGIIALQLHGGLKVDEVTFKGIEMRELTAAAAAAPAGGAWVTLFNGKDLTGWMSAGGDPPDVGWVVRDGAIFQGGWGPGPGSRDLWTKDRYGDFELEVEYKTDGNSGVFIRAGDPADRFAEALEVQIDAPMAGPSKLTTGALYGVAAPTREAARANDWNTMLVTARGSRVEVALNGQAVLNVDLDNWTVAGQNPDLTTNRYKSALRDLRRQGHIGLQAHKGNISFRKIRIRPLP